MPAFWVEFKIRPAGCVEAENEVDALRIAEETTGATPSACSSLPSPAEPRLNKVEHEFSGRKVVVPSFCYSPNACKGRTSCPKRRACDD